MQIQSYLQSHDQLAEEELYFQIPMRKEFLLSQLSERACVLDVGCLGGRLAQWLMHHHHEVWGVELNPHAAQLARTRGVSVKEADVNEGIPFESQTFHLIHAGGVLEHLYDTQVFFQEAHRVLKDQGRLVLMVSNLNSLENRWKILSGEYLSRAGGYPEDHFGGNLRLFNQAKIRELCERNGFELEKTQGIPSLESQGKTLDHSFRWVGRMFPQLSKMLLVSAKKK